MSKIERVDCDACRNGYYEGDKIRCKLFGISGCKPDYEIEFQCSDCRKFNECEITQGASFQTCDNFELEV